MKTPREITITVTLPSDDVALALAQFCKRACYATALRLSDPHKEGEADDMMAGIVNLQHGLMRAGFDPR